MCEEEVDRASAAQDFTKLLVLDTLQLWVQVETAQLGNEEFEIGTRCLTAEEVRVEAHLHEQVICSWLMPVKLDERIKNFTIDEASLLERL